MPKNTDFRCVLAKNLALFGKRLAACSALLLAFTLLHRYILRNAVYEYAESEKAASSHEKIAASPKSSLCTLRLEGEKLKIYSSDGIPEYAAVIDVSCLTDYDRELLSSGICASFEELSELIHELVS